MAARWAVFAEATAVKEGGMAATMVVAVGGADWEDWAASGGAMAAAAAQPVGRVATMEAWAVPKGAAAREATTAAAARSLLQALAAAAAAAHLVTVGGKEVGTRCCSRRPRRWAPFPCGGQDLLTCLKLSTTCSAVPLARCEIRCT